MKVAIIPARGGSKRIPNKNVKSFRGKPIIAYSIEAALQSNIFDRIIVSTDDDAIAEVAKECNAEVPFKRPPEISDDYSTMTDVLLHAVDWLIGQKQTPEYICTIFATAPFLRAEDLTKSFGELLQNQEADYSLAVTNYPFPIQRAVRKDSDNYLRMFNSENFLKRSQDLEEAYHDAGQFSWARSHALKKNKIPFDCNCLPYIIPRHRVQDIDTAEDWEDAELAHEILEKHRNS